jgi:hypothetical protein
MTSGKVALSSTKFGGMVVPAAQLDLGRPFQEKLSCPFDERREVVCSAQHRPSALPASSPRFSFSALDVIGNPPGRHGLCEHPDHSARRPTILRPWALAGALMTGVQPHHE